MAKRGPRIGAASVGAGTDPGAHLAPVAEAFDELRRTSQARNVELRDVADHVTRTRELPCTTRGR